MLIISLISIRLEPFLADKMDVIIDSTSQGFSYHFGEENEFKKIRSQKDLCVLVRVPKFFVKIKSNGFWEI